MRATGLIWTITCTLACSLREPRAFAETPPTKETTILPLAGGNSDIGLGLGYIGAMTRLQPKVEPYAWRLESLGLVTYLPTTKSIQYVDNYLLISIPEVKKGLRVDVRLTYVRERLNFLGLGNASKIPDGTAWRDPFLTYGRHFAQAEGVASYALAHGWVLHWGASFIQNVLAVSPGTLLAERHASGSARHLIHINQRHGVLTFSYGAAFDQRDSELIPRRGQYHTLRLDLSPGGTSAIPFTWARSNLALRGYFSASQNVVLAARWVTDLLSGEAPIYELARYDDTNAIGGVNGVRGVPGQRYYGKLKSFVNLEARVSLFDFKLLGKSNRFGLTPFLDVGRVWTDLHPRPELDGHGLGLKFGVGLGARIQVERWFVLRLDTAWSPDASPIGVYLSSGHMF